MPRGRRAAESPGRRGSPRIPARSRRARGVRRARTCPSRVRAPDAGRVGVDVFALRAGPRRVGPVPPPPGDPAHPRRPGRRPGPRRLPPAEGRSRSPATPTRSGRDPLRRANRPSAGARGGGCNRARRRGRAAGAAPGHGRGREAVRARVRGADRARVRVRAREAIPRPPGDAGARVRSGARHPATGAAGVSRGRSQSPPRDRIAARPPRRRGGSSNGGTSSNSGSTAAGARHPGRVRFPGSRALRDRPPGPAVPGRGLAAFDRDRDRFRGSRLPNDSISGSGIPGSVRSLGSRSVEKEGGTRCRVYSEPSGSPGRGRSGVDRDRWVRLGGRSGSKTGSCSNSRINGSSGSSCRNSRSRWRSGGRPCSGSRPQPISVSQSRSAASGRAAGSGGSGAPVRMSSA